MPENLSLKVRRIGDACQRSFEIPWEADESRGSRLHTQVSDIAFHGQESLKEMKS